MFGLSAVALEVCRLVQYVLPGNYTCYTDVLKVLTVVRILFFTSQSLFLFSHHKVSLSFSPHFHHPGNLLLLGIPPLKLDAN